MNNAQINRCNRHGNTVVSPARFRVYMLICAAADAGRQISMQEIADRLGWKSKNATFECVQKLAQAGLVSMGEPMQARTIRPLYRVRLFKEEAST